jgi:hypothetical protein
VILNKMKGDLGLKRSPWRVSGLILIFLAGRDRTGYREQGENRAESSASIAAATATAATV